MDGSDLAFFVALTRTGNLAAAAKYMGRDHSTGARRIENPGAWSWRPPLLISSATLKGKTVRRTGWCASADRLIS